MLRLQTTLLPAALLMGLIPVSSLAGGLADLFTEAMRDLRSIERSGVCAANPFKLDSAGNPLAPACAPVVARCPVKMIPLDSVCKASIAGGSDIPRYTGGIDKEVNTSGNEVTCRPTAYTTTKEVFGYASMNCAFQVPGVEETVVVRSRSTCYNGDANILGYDLQGLTSGNTYCASQLQMNSATGSCQQEHITLKLLCMPRPSESSLQKLNSLRNSGFDSPF